MQTESGQATAEAAVILTTLLLILLVGVSLLLAQMGKVILTKWAAKNSRCVAETDRPEICRTKTVNELQKYFAFKNVNVSEQIVEGIVHTKIRARLLEKYPMESKFDLLPGEYKRVSK